MAGTGQGYDLSVTTYSPDGRIFQIDYAQKCIDNSPTCLAIVCKDGIVLAAQKLKLSKMLVQGTNKRCYAVNRNAGCTVCGMNPEGRHILNRIREEARSYKQNFGEVIPGYLLAERLGHYVHYFTTHAALRPIGSSMLVANYEEKEGCTLFSVEPSGLVQKWFGKALGKGRQLANTEIEKLDLSTLTCKEALFHCAKILHKVHDEQKEFELEMNWICEATGYTHGIVPQDLVDQANKDAKQAIDDEDDE